MLWAALATLITDVYCMEHREESIPSFTLVCGGKDRFVINRHLFGWWALGMTPIWLT